MKRERSSNSLGNDTLEVMIYSQDGGVSVTEHQGQPHSHKQAHKARKSDSSQSAEASGTAHEKERRAGPPSKSLREQIKEGKRKQKGKVRSGSSQEWDVEFVLTDQMQNYFEKKTPRTSEDGAAIRDDTNAAIAEETTDAITRENSGATTEADMEKICQALEDALVDEDPSIPPVNADAELEAQAAKPSVSTEQLKEVMVRTQHAMYQHLQLARTPPLRTTACACAAILTAVRLGFAT